MPFFSSSLFFLRLFFGLTHLSLFGILFFESFAINYDFIAVIIPAVILNKTRIPILTVKLFTALTPVPVDELSNVFI